MTCWALFSTAASTTGTNSPAKPGLRRSILLRTGRFNRRTWMPRSRPCRAWSADPFQRWLAAFYASNARQPNQAMATQANAMAERIAQSLCDGLPDAQWSSDAPPNTCWRFKVMAELLQIEEPTPPRLAPAHLAGVSGVGFRLLYLPGCAQSTSGVALWGYAPQWIARCPASSGMRTKCLGFVVTVAAGFC